MLRENFLRKTQWIKLKTLLFLSHLINFKHELKQLHQTNFHQSVALCTAPERSHTQLYFVANAAIQEGSKRSGAHTGTHRSPAKVLRENTFRIFTCPQVFSTLPTNKMSTTVPTNAHSNTRSVIQNFRHNPKCLLVCLCVGAVVQGKMYLRYRQ